ncbi:MAG: hypothetical protein AAF500_08380 [Myxococcota bacterium]
MTRIVLCALLCGFMAVGTTACSKGESSSESGAIGEGSGGPVQGSDAAIPTIKQAVRVWMHDQPTVDLVGAELGGKITARTPSEAVMHFDGYRAILTTAGDIVVRIAFHFDTAKPTLFQLTELYGQPEEVSKGALLETEVPVTGRRVRMLARTVDLPPTESTLVEGLLLDAPRAR